MTKKTIPDFLNEGFVLPGDPSLESLPQGTVVDLVLLHGGYRTPYTLEVKRETLNYFSNYVNDGDSVEDEAIALGATQERYGYFLSDTETFFAIKVVREPRDFEDVEAEAQQVLADGFMTAEKLSEYLSEARSTGEVDGVDWDSSSRYC